MIVASIYVLSWFTGLIILPVVLDMANNLDSEEYPTWGLAYKENKRQRLESQDL